MAQAGYTPIQLYYSTTASAAPSSGNLANGELALNITDGKLYYKDNGGVVQLLATKAGASGDVVGPASSTDNALVRFDGTTGKLVQNSAAVLDDSGNLTGLAAVTTSGALTLNGGTANGVAYLNGSKVLTTGSALTFDGTRLGVGGAAVELLDVFGTGQFRADLKVNGTFSLQRSSGSLYLPVAAYTNGSGSILSGGTKGDIVAFGNVGGDGIIFANANAEAMRLTSTGLGIGTSSPSEALTITNDATYKLSLKRAADGSYAAFGATGNALLFYNNGAERMRLDSSGNLGLGVTPSAWNSSYKALDIASGGAAVFGGTSFAGIANNSFVNSSFQEIYKTSNPALQYLQVVGQHRWYTAPSGTAGNAISFTQAMTLDAGGNLIVGDTSQVGSSKISMTVNPSLANVLAAKTSTNGDIAAFRILSSDGNEQGAINVNTSGQNMTFRVANTERARIDSSGQFSIGKTQASESFSTGNGYGFASPTVDPFFSVVNVAASGVNSCIYLNKRNSNATNGLMTFLSNNGSSQGAVGSITHNGSSTAYNTTSDYRLKRLVGEVAGHGERIDALNPVEFDWLSTGKRDRGFLAHEFQAVYANSVTGEKDGVDKNGEPEYQAMQAGGSEVIADLVAEIKSLRRRVAALELN